MPKGGPFPGIDSEYNEYVIVVVPYLKNNQNRLGIFDDQIALMDSKFGNWDNWYPKSQNPATRGPVANKNKDLARAELTKALQDIYSGIAASRLTADDCLVLRLKKGVGKDTVPTEIKVVDYAPALKIEAAGRLFHDMRFSDPKNPESPRAMPEGNNIELQIYIGEAGLTEKQIRFDDIRTVTKYLYRVEFKEEEKGKTVYYRSCYKKGGARSPFTAILSAVIGEAV